MLSRAAIIILLITSAADNCSQQCHGQAASESTGNPSLPVQILNYGVL